MHYYLMLAAVLVAACPVQSQVSIVNHFNVYPQPVWGPVGTDHAQYYYLPDIETYYDVSQMMFYYNEGGSWVGRSVLPERYRNYDLYNSYRVAVDGPAPYLHHRMYSDQYPARKGRYELHLIRDNAGIQ